MMYQRMKWIHRHVQTRNYKYGNSPITDLINKIIWRLQHMPLSSTAAKSLDSFTFVALPRSAAVIIPACIKCLFCEFSSVIKASNFFGHWLMLVASLDKAWASRKCSAKSVAKMLLSITARASAYSSWKIDDSISFHFCKKNSTWCFLKGRDGILSKKLNIKI